MKTQNTLTNENVAPASNQTLTMLKDEHDAMIATLLAEKHGDNLIFDATRTQWRVFKDRIWLTTEKSDRLLWGYYNQLIMDINDGQYPHLPIGTDKWLVKSMNHGKRSSVLKDVQSLTKVGIDEQDANLNLIGVQENVYDIQTKAVRPAKASDLVFKSLGTNFDADAKCPEWLKFLDTVMQGNQEMINYLQRLVGYFLTASTQEQEIYYFYGSGANGKSTFLDLVKALMGSYGVKIASDTFIKGSQGATPLGKSTSLADLKGARLAITDETNDSNVSFDTQILKSISGDDEITARRLRENPFTFKSTAKIVMYGNDKPHANINDEGFWRRFKFIKFGYVVPKENRVSDLLDQLKAEMPGILNWALEGLEAWEKNGLQTPQSVIDDSEDYREELDTVKEFLKTNVDQAPGNLIPLVMLYEGYSDWCKNNMKGTETKQAFSRRAKAYLVDDTRLATPHKDKKMRGYKNIRLI
ncbi:phage/plasmid primase, P4 family [Porticoccaceae bacterium]|nr:phage/plasmid primase, P4 family [Porticoccaceae bacterium]